jgi:translation elongation factor EF-Tu-like GTPase
MTTPPGGPGGPDLWMTINDVFHIRGRGTVVTGQLEGSVPLNVGDILVCEGASWQVSGIEKFRSVLTTAEPGSNIGILLRDGPNGDVLRHRTVTFERGTSRFEPQPKKLFEPQPKKSLWRRN